MCLAIQDTNLFVGTSFGGIFRSSINGTSWTEVNNGLPGWTTINSIVVSGTNLFAGIGNDGVFLSTDNGDSWTMVNNGMTSTDVSCLVASGNNIFAGVPYAGIFVTSDNGSNWTAVNNGLPEWPLVLSFVATGTNIIAGLETGTFLSTNNGASWTDISTGLTNQRIISLAVSGDNVFAGSWGSGTWKRPLSEIITGVTSNELTDGTLLMQNYPNPFSSTTTIKFEMKISAFVNLSVFDVRGREVAVLSNEQLNSGTHQEIWDGAGYPGGIYYCKLSAGENVETMKIILMK